ncbi:hypothetical protein JCGZ_13485 [Jatropha curcas]|uniref:Uncharacterized protein n=1 Tax=Jatropha curcas TaxID=180498 RepID=A0A067LNI3_JATCU|nr:hypothetical protein JCGZ_13485 [Jatropha curcas]
MALAGSFVHKTSFPLPVATSRLICYPRKTVIIRCAGPPKQPKISSGSGPQINVGPKTLKKSQREKEISLVKETKKSKGKVDDDTAMETETSK